MSEHESISPGEINPLKNSVSEEKWYAVYTRPRAEKLVFHRLTEESVETFLPLQKTFRIWSDRKKLVERPLLPSYIFVRTNKKNFPRVYNINGVVKFVSFEGQPVSIPQKQIDNLRLLINSDYERLGHIREIRTGDNVEVISGSLVRSHRRADQNRIQKPGYSPN